jgi:hypothetical protein
LSRKRLVVTAIPHQQLEATETVRHWPILEDRSVSGQSFLGLERRENAGEDSNLEEGEDSALE